MPPAMFQPIAIIPPVANARRSVNAVTEFGVTGVPCRARPIGRLKGRFT